MNYNWNIRIWVEQYLSQQLRKPARIAGLYALLAPYQYMWDKFTEKAEAIDFDTQFDSETICIEEKLNILFDPILKRISIVTNDEVETVDYTFWRNEVVENNAPKYTYWRAEVVPHEDEMYTFWRSEIQNPFDFTVNVPAGVFSSYAARIHSEINKYRFAGMRYNINQT